MTNFRFAMAIAMIAIGTFVASCSTQEGVAPNNTTSLITDDVKDKLTTLGFDVSDLKTTRHTDLATGADLGEALLVEGDIVMTPDQLDEMLDSELVDGPNAEQFRTRNLVRSPRVIRVLGLTAGPNALSPAMIRGLRLAVQNYNQLGIGLTFRLTLAGSGARDIIVGRVNGAAGGVAGFPSGGNPFFQVALFSGLDRLNDNINEHVITHEFGHCIGLRHTDYANRSVSCGGAPVNEGDGGVGAIPIPGTPNTPTGDRRSIMMACFNGGVNGEFTRFDRIALDFLY